MKLQAQSIILLLVFPLIWLLDSTWWHMSPDAVIIVGLLPLAWFIAKQRSRKDTDLSGSSHHTALASGCLALGIILNQLALMAFAWSWLAVVHILPASQVQRARLWVLCAGAFPWVLVDGEVIGWFFRLSGASITSWVFEVMGLEVVARGTQLEIDGLPISIEAACGGLQLLQVLMSGGIALTLIRFPGERTFWVMLVLLPMLAWVANTLRIVVISAWGLAYGAEAAAGAFHTWGAIFVIVSMLVFYLLCSDVIVRFVK